MTAAVALDVPAAAGPAIAAEVRRYGELDVETGGFLLAPEGTGSVCTVAFVGTSGIIRRRLQLQISEIALDQLFAFAGEQGCWVPAQFHSHAGGAFLSRTDREYGLRVPGFISAVIPGFADPPMSLDAWTWWRFDRGEWHTVGSPSAGGCDLRQVVFDDDGVRGR
jgi:proteasome lid subunit RPN8/RPN11